MRAATEALHAADGTLTLRETRRSAVKRDDGTLRLDVDGAPHRFVRLELLETGAALLSAADCRELAAKLVGFARELEQ